MATYTQNYALHQWEDTDDFLRSDFNADFLKLYTAIKGEKTALQESIATNAYNIYNLILQNYYEGKVTSYKKALYFDGFTSTTEPTGRSISDSLVIYNDTLHLPAAGQETVEWETSTTTKNSTTASISTTELTATGVGTLLGFTFYVASGTTTSQNTVQCYLNGTKVDSTILKYSDRHGTELTYMLETPFTVEVGDVVKFSVIYNTSLGMTYYCQASTTLLAGKMLFNAHGGTEGTATYGETTGLDWDGSYLWVRYSGGAMSPAVGANIMTLISTQDAQTLEGETCTEAYFTGAGGSDSLALTLTLTHPEGETMEVYDYGLVLI